MNKKTVGIICAVVLGICAFALLSGLVQLLFAALSIDDLSYIYTADGAVDGLQNKILLLCKWTSLSLCFVLIAAAAVTALCFFGKRKALNALSAALWEFTALLSLAFLIAVYVCAKNTVDSAAYVSAVAYCDQFLTVSVASLIVGAYMTVCAVKSHREGGRAESAVCENSDVCQDKNPGNGGGQENEESV